MADKNKYDIFISYRREGGAQYARILQLEIEKRGYRVFLDYEELTDGVFGDNIREAIHEAPIFMMVLSAHYLDRCKNEGDWVREEIMQAIAQGKHFIPVNPDNAFDGIPDDTPEEIKTVVDTHQHSEVNFGQLLGASIDRLVKNRVSQHVDHSKALSWLLRPGKRAIAATFAVVIAIAAVGAYFIYVRNVQRQNEALIAMLKAQAEESAKAIEQTCGQLMNWSDDISATELKAVADILYNTVEVQGGTFLAGASLADVVAGSVPAHDAADVGTDPVPARTTWENLVCPELELPPVPQTVQTFFIGKYEVTTAQWHAIMGGTYEVSDSLLPVTNISYKDCLSFTQRLTDLTGLSFRLPTEAEWEYAARGGVEPDCTIFAGSDNAEEVAWHTANANDKPHVCDASNSPMYPNGLDLYDMSGNVAEWTSTPCLPYDSAQPVPDSSALAVRGGHFASDAYELTVWHRQPKKPADKDRTVGLRLVIAKDS